MPIALDPNETIEVSVEFDDKKPAEQRPVFLCRFLTARRQRQLENLVHEAAVLLDADKLDAAYPLMDEAYAIIVKSWRNMLDEAGKVVEFNTETGSDGVIRLAAINDVLTRTEKWDLLVRLQHAGTIQESKKKRSALLARTDAAPSAPAAETDVSESPSSNAPLATVLDKTAPDAAGGG